MIVIGIDPGLDSKDGSPTAVTIFDSRTKDIFACQLFTKGLFDENNDKIRYISTSIGQYVATVLDTVREREIVACIEDFVMRGKGGQSLQQLRGGIIACLPDFVDEVFTPRNTSIKKHVAGDGRADKAQVADAVKVWFKLNRSSTDMIQEMIETKNWDLTDSLAIGITGVEQWEVEHR